MYFLIVLHLPVKFKKRVKKYTYISDGLDLDL